MGRHEGLAPETMAGGGEKAGASTKESDAVAGVEAAPAADMSHLILQ